MTPAHYIAITFCLLAAAVVIYAIRQALKHPRWDSIQAGDAHEEFVARKAMHPVASGDSMEDLVRGEVK